MLKTVPIFALAVTVSLAALVLSSRRPVAAPVGASEGTIGADAWFV